MGYYEVCVGIDFEDCGYGDDVVWIFECLGFVFFVLL